MSKRKLKDVNDTNTEEVKEKPIIKYKKVKEKKEKVKEVNPLKNEEKTLSDENIEVFIIIL
jgi:hypothetical protein